MSKVTAKVEAWTITGATILAFAEKHGVDPKTVVVAYHRVQHYEDWIDEWFELSCELPVVQETIPA